MSQTSAASPKPVKWVLFSSHDWLANTHPYPEGVFDTEELAAREVLPLVRAGLDYLVDPQSKPGRGVAWSERMRLEVEPIERAFQREMYAHGVRLYGQLIRREGVAKDEYFITAVRDHSETRKPR